jgi:probable rRNA maturation factor
MIEIEVEAEAWTRALPDAETLVRQAAEAVLSQPSPTIDPQPAVSALVDEGLELAAVPVAVAARVEPKAGDVTVLLADDAAVQELNRAHRGQDKPTNVLSFPAAASAAPHLGDVALAYETCAREAEEQGKPLADHLKHLVAHGVLHLLGWDHQTEAEALAMEARERDILAGLGTPDPYRDGDIPLHG